MEKTEVLEERKEDIIVMDAGIGDDFFSKMACCTAGPLAKGGN